MLPFDLGSWIELEQRGEREKYESVVVVIVSEVMRTELSKPKPRPKQQQEQAWELALELLGLK